MAELRPISEFLQYLASHAYKGANLSDPYQLPSLSELSQELKMSVAALREQLEVARALGLVDVRPRTGIRRLPYSFFPAVRQSLAYAVTTDQSLFLAYSDLRDHLETAYWEEATCLLTSEDHQTLQGLVSRAWEKLNGNPVHIPFEEHRKLHLTIFNRLENPFVQGLLEAYWELYEAIGLNMYADYHYLQRVWQYHQEMVEAICSADYDRGYQALVEHKDLLYHRP